MEDPCFDFWATCSKRLYSIKRAWVLTDLTFFEQLPVVWDDWIDIAEADVAGLARKVHQQRERIQKKYQKSLDEWEDHNKVVNHIIREQAKGRLQNERIHTEDDLLPEPDPPILPDLPEEAVPRMKRGEMELFMKLSAALTVLLARTVRLEDLQQAHGRLLEYLKGYVEVSS